MKQPLVFLLALALLFSCAIGESAIFDPEAPHGDTASQAYAALMDSVAAQLRQYDGSGAESFAVTIQDPFGVPEQERHDFFDTLFLHTIRENPEFFWINLSNRPQSYDADSGLLTYHVRIFPEFQGDGFAAAQREFEAALEAALSEIFAPGMSEMEKVLSAFGWIKQYVQYDPEAGWDAYSAYSALVNRSAVCHGCAVTMNLLLQRAGVGCCTVLSYVEDMDVYHIWNAVCVNGSWYNIDPTAGHVMGHLSYSRFMRSTAEMVGNLYCEHETRMHVQCDESYPADTPWRAVNTTFLYNPERQSLVNVENCVEKDGKFYYTNTATYRALSIDEAGNATSTPLATIPAMVLCCSPEYEDQLYYLTYYGDLRAHRISTGEDRSLSQTNYEGLYLWFEEETEALRILDKDGALQETLLLPQ